MIFNANSIALFITSARLSRWEVRLYPGQLHHAICKMCRNVFESIKGNHTEALVPPNIGRLLIHSQQCRGALNQHTELQRRQSTNRLPCYIPLLCDLFMAKIPLQHLGKVLSQVLYKRTNAHMHTYLHWHLHSFARHFHRVTEICECVRQPDIT